MSEGHHAVFLSYASQDSEAAKRICEALRAAGVEVWFDQNELVGGDAWDAKIRGQIAACSLFIPIVSANTQARLEGYFRLEWKLAAQRTHAIADGVPFLLPVVIDAIDDRAALVPDEFRVVQWTRLSAQEPNRFAERVRIILNPQPETSTERPRNITPLLPGRSKRRLVGLTVVVIVALGIGGWILGKGSHKVDTVPSHIAEARQLVKRALSISWETREARDLADSLCEKALSLAPEDVPVLVDATWVDVKMIFPQLYDVSEARRLRAQKRAALAVTLAPNASETRAVQAEVFAHAIGTPEMIQAAEATYRDLIQKDPSNTDLQVRLAQILRSVGRNIEAAEIYLKIGDFEQAGWEYFYANEYAKAEQAVERALAQDVRVHRLRLKAYIAVTGFENLGLARAAHERIAPADLVFEMSALDVAYYSLFERNPKRVKEVLAGIPQEVLFTGARNCVPKGYLLGWARQMEGFEDAARTEWEGALKVVKRELQRDPNNVYFAQFAAWLEGKLGHSEAANDAIQRYRVVAGLRPGEWDWRLTSVLVAMGKTDDAIQWILTASRPTGRQWNRIHSELRFSPDYQSLRGDSRFESFLRDTLPADALPL